MQKLNFYIIWKWIHNLSKVITNPKQTSKCTVIFKCGNKSYIARFTESNWWFPKWKPVCSKAELDLSQPWMSISRLVLSPKSPAVMEVDRELWSSVVKSPLRLHLSNPHDKFKAHQLLSHHANITRFNQFIRVGYLELDVGLGYKNV